MPRAAGDRYVCEKCGTELVYEKGCPCPPGMLHALESLSPVIAANAPVALPEQMRSIDLAPLMLQVLGVECR